ncbi:MAG: hypothetical protein HZA59_00525, partial [Hydrogenophilales bacterium]|nr:hypothetical protein [Hydrogenophilales bacterium]
MKNRIMLLVATLAMVFAVNLAPAETMKGRILGEQCAKSGKIGECYLKWAEPMVFWTQEGDYFHIKLAGKDLDKASPDGQIGKVNDPNTFAGKDLDEVSLDKAFGQEVEVEGKVLKQGKDKGKIEIAKLTLLNPPGK